MIDLDHFDFAALPIDLSRQAGSSDRQDHEAADPDVVLLARTLAAQAGQGQERCCQCSEIATAG